MKIEGDLVLKEGKVYILKDEELRTEIIQLHHNVLVAGHGERQKMTELVLRNYWWPGVAKNVRKYVDRCDLYQRMNYRTEALVGKLITNEVPKNV